MKLFFSRIIVSILLGFFFIIIIYKFTDLSNDVLSGIAVGTACALIYVISGFISFYYALTLSQESFTKVFVLSIGGRFLLIIGVIALILKFTEVNTEIFLISFFIWYFIFQIWEVLSLNQTSIKKV